MVGAGPNWHHARVPTALRPRDAALALTLFTLAVALRLPLAGLTGTVADALDPLRGALAFRDRLELTHPGFFHFGYGRDLSFVPFVLGADSLAEAGLRRLLAQALLAPLVFLAARRLTPTTLGPLLAALLLATGEELLHTAVSGAEGYLAAEWGAAALLALSFGDRRLPQLALGACLAMALMNHPFAAPTLLLLALHPRGRTWGLGAFLAVLAPQILRVAAALTKPDTDVLAFAPLASFDPGVFLSSIGHGDVVLLLLAPFALAATRPLDSLPRRLALLGLLGFGASLLELAFVGSAHGWYWRPLAPWFALLFALAIAPRPRLQTMASLLVAAVCLASLVRARAAFDRDGEGLRYAEHASAFGQLLQDGEARAPLGILGVAFPGEAGYREDVLPVVVDLQIAARTDLLARSRKEMLDGPLLVHLAGPPAQIARLRADWHGRAELLSMGRGYVILEFAQGIDVQPLIEQVCALAEGDVNFSDTGQWQRMLGTKQRSLVVSCRLGGALE